MRKTEHKKIIPPNLYEFSAFPSTARLWFSTFNSRQTTLLKCARYLNAFLFFHPPTPRPLLISSSTSTALKLFTPSDHFLCRIPISMHTHTCTHFSAAFSCHTFFIHTTLPSTSQPTLSQEPNFRCTFKYTREVAAVNLVTPNHPLPHIFTTKIRLFAIYLILSATSSQILFPQFIFLTDDIQNKFPRRVCWGW